MGEAPYPRVSIIIKALNEEGHIAASVESALAALDGLIGEVILADSASDDDTVKIAAKYPISIVSLRNARDRSCGAGAQLGYQYSAGNYVCLIDGDMYLRKQFIAAAVCFLEDHPEFAGAGGNIIEHEKGNLEYIRRVKAEYIHHREGLTSCLEGGGLYRRNAITTVGYLTDRNLHCGEEHDLAVRLKAADWKLARLNIAFVDHHGHSGSGYRLLLRRWTSGYAFGAGEILRASLGRAHFWSLIKHMKKLLAQIAIVHAWWLCMLAALFQSAEIFLAIAILPFVTMSARRRSVRLGTYSVAVWNLFAAGMWPGLLQRRSNPADWIESIVVRGRPPWTETRVEQDADQIRGRIEFGTAEP